MIEKHKRAGKSWNLVEAAIVLYLYNKGCSTVEIAKNNGRTENAINCFIRNLNRGELYLDMSRLDNIMLGLIVTKYSNIKLLEYLSNATSNASELLAVEKKYIVKSRSVRNTGCIKYKIMTEEEAVQFTEVYSNNNSEIFMLTRMKIDTTNHLVIDE